MPENTPKSRFELLVELIKAIIWPLFATVILFLFWEPIRTISTQLPSLIGRSETITIAGVSLKVSKRLTQQASPKLAAALAKLSPQGLRQLVDQRGASLYPSENADRGKSEYAELISLGLAEEVPQTFQADSDRKLYPGFIVKLTPMGDEGEKFIYALLSEVVRDLPEQSDHAQP